MTTRMDRADSRKARTESRILVGYCIFVFGGLSAVASFFWWVCLNC